MRNITLVTALMLTAATFAVSANAQDAAAPAAGAHTGAYVQVGLSDTKLDDDYGAVNFGAGYDINKYVAVEADFEVGVTNKTITYGGYDIKTKLNYSAGAFVVGKLPVSANVDLTARVGYVKAQVKASAGSNSATVDEDGAAYGIGVRYFPNGGLNGVRADLTRVKLDDGDADIYQVSYVRRF